MIIRPPPEDESHLVFTDDEPRRLRILPFVPMKRLLDQLDFLTLLDLALMYPPVYSYLQTKKLKVLDFKWFITGETHYVIQIFPADQTEPRVVFRLGSKPENSTVRFFRGVKFQVARVGRQFVVHVPADRERILVKQYLFRTLGSIMEIQHFHLKSSGDIRAECAYVRKFKSFWLDNLTFNSGNFKFMIEERLQIDTLKLENCTFFPPTRIFVKLRPRVIEMDNADWLSKHSFLRMECEHMTISPNHRNIAFMDQRNQNPRIGQTDFLLAWAKGGVVNLRSLKMKVTMEWEERWLERYRDAMEALRIEIMGGVQVGNDQDLVKRVRRRDGQQALIGLSERHFFFEVEDDE